MIRERSFSSLDAPCSVAGISDHVADPEFGGTE